MIGTDHYWPEVPLVMALKGAQLILWSHGPEPVPQAYPSDITMRVRTLDDHITLVRASYAGKLPYLCSNHPRYTGEPLARGCVIDRSGVVVADTGFRPGVAVAPIDLARGKDIYHLTFEKDRKLFHYLVDADLKPAVFKGTRKPIKVSIAQVAINQGPNPDPNSEFAKTLDEAGRRGSDVILMSEFGFASDTEVAQANVRNDRREGAEIPKLHHHRWAARSPGPLLAGAPGLPGPTSGTAAAPWSASTAFRSTARAPSCPCSRPISV